MRFELTGRHVDITPALRRLVEGKLAKLERLLNHRALSAHAVLTREKHRHRADITLHARGEKFLHGVGNTTAWETSIAQAIEKITQQAQKVKGKWEARKNSARGDRTPEESPIALASPEAVDVRPVDGARRRLPGPAGDRARMPPIMRTSRQTIRPMSVADAARAVDTGSDGVVVFRDVETATVSVLYRRRDGELTLVQAEA